MIRKATHLFVYWSKRERDFTFSFPDYKWNGALLHSAFCVQTNEDGKTLVQELTDRGFDVETLRFSIRKKGQA